MRIVQLTSDWRPNGGAATYVRLLSRSLARAGHDVLVVHPETNGPTETPVPGVTVRSVPAGFSAGVDAGSLAGAAELDGVLAAFTPNVVHVHGVNSVALEERIRRRYRMIRTIHVYEFCPSGTKYHFALDRACVYDTTLWCLPRQAYLRCTLSKRPGVWWRQYRRAAAGNQHNRSCDTIVASEYVKREAVRTGFDPARVTVVPYFVEPVAAPSAPLGQTVLFVGRVAREKGADVLIDALASLKSPWRCVIAGDGIDLPHVRRVVRERRVTDRVECAGWLNGDALAAAYDRAAVVVMPSRWPEPFGITGLEAFSRGRPVVAFGVGGIPEWLDDGVSGCVVPPGDTRALAARVAWLLAHRDQAAAMGARGRERVARDFSAARHLAQLVPLYSRLPEPARG